MLAATSIFHPTNILVPLDFSASSDSALATAADLASHFHAHLVLLHVVPAFPVAIGLEFSTTFYPDNYLESTRKQAEKVLATRLEGLAARGLQARSTVEIGNDVVGNILAVVNREAIDMVVLSTHGMSGWKPMIFGSTAEKVVKLLQCPLLLLRATASVAA